MPPQEVLKAQRLRTFHLISGRETIQYAQTGERGAGLRVLDKRCRGLAKSVSEG